MTETIAYRPGLSPVAGKDLCARFDGGRLSSDGGVLLFPGIERRRITIPLNPDESGKGLEPVVTTDVMFGTGWA